MELWLLRHGSTEGNERRAYVGLRSDEPLSERGRTQCVGLEGLPHVERVYASPMLRARQTAELCFPNAKVTEVKGLEEFDFGAFEGRSARDMVDDEAYRAWVDGWCVGRCPGGESRAEFVSRTSEALDGMLRDAASRGEERVVVVAHGGTIMAALSSFASAYAQEDGYFEWQVGPCEGYEATVSFQEEGLALENPRKLPS